MANATTTTPGSIILAGDLTGTATSPALRPTGVTPGAHWPWYFWVDSKGRILKSSSDISWATLDPFVPDASGSVKGVMSPGIGLTTIDGTLSVKDASTSTKGIIQVTEGDGLYITAGVLEYLPPDATDIVKGVVQVGSGLSVTSGTISIDESSISDATYISTGIISVGTDLSVTNGVLSFNLASVLPTASDTVLGGIKVGTSLQINSGVLDLANTYVRTNTANTFSKAQVSALNTRDGMTGSVDVDITTYGDNQLWNLTGNITIANSSDALLVPGAVFSVIVKQDATGSRTVSFGTNYLLGDGITLSTAPNTYDQLTFIVIDSSTILVLFSPDWV